MRAVLVGLDGAIRPPIDVDGAPRALLVPYLPADGGYRTTRYELDTVVRSDAGVVEAVVYQEVLE